MKVRFLFGLQWLALLCLSLAILPVWLLVGVILGLRGSRPLFSERGTFDLDGTPVRYQVFSLEFRPGQESPWLINFLNLYGLDLLPSLGSGLRGWLSPKAVARLWFPAGFSRFEHRG